MISPFAATLSAPSRPRKWRFVEKALAPVDPAASVRPTLGRGASMTAAEATPDARHRRPCRPRLPRPSQGARLSRLHRGVGALLLLRHAGAARPLHGQVSAAARATSRTSPSFDSFRRLYGGLDGQPLASAIFGTYSASVYLTPILGGLLADRLLGKRRTVLLGAITMAVGHFLMAFEVELPVRAALPRPRRAACSRAISPARSARSTSPRICAAPTPSRSSISASMPA